VNEGGWEGDIEGLAVNRFYGRRMGWWDVVEIGS